MEFEFEVWLRGLPSETVLHVTPSETAPRGAANVVSAGELLGWAAVYPGPVDSSGWEGLPSHVAEWLGRLDSLGGDTPVRFQAIVGPGEPEASEAGARTPLRVPLGWVRNVLVAGQRAVMAEVGPRFVADRALTDEQLAAMTDAELLEAVVGYTEQHLGDVKISSPALGELRGRLAAAALTPGPEPVQAGLVARIAEVLAFERAPEIDPDVHERRRLAVIEPLLAEAHRALVAASTPSAPVPWQQQVIDQHQLEQELASRIGVRDDETATHAIARWALSKLTPDTRRRVASEAFDVEPRFGPSNTAKATTPDESAMPDEQDEGAVYGLVVEAPSASYQARSVIGRLETSLAGNLIMRVGRQNEPGLAGPWHQTEHVVLAPDEALRFAVAIVAKVAKQELTPIDLAGQRAARLFDKLDQLHASMAGAGVEPEFPWTIGEDLPYATLVETTLGELGELLDVIRPRDIKLTLGGSIDGTGYWVLDDVPLPDGVPHALAAGAPRIALRDPDGRSWAGWMALPDLDSLRFQLDLGRDWLEGKRPVPDGGELTHAQQTSALSSAMRGDVGDLPTGWDDDEVHDVVACLIDNGYRIIGSRSPVPASQPDPNWYLIPDWEPGVIEQYLVSRNSTPTTEQLKVIRALDHALAEFPAAPAAGRTWLHAAIVNGIGSVEPQVVHDSISMDGAFPGVRKLISQWRLRASEFEATFDPDDEVNEAVVDELRTCANDLWDALDRPNLTADEAAIADGVPVKAILEVARRLDAKTMALPVSVAGRSAYAEAATMIRDVVPVPPGALGRLAEAIGVPEAQLEQLAESIANRPDDDPDDVSIIGAVHALRDWAADGLAPELYEPVVKVLPGLMVKLVELGWRDQDGECRCGAECVRCSPNVLVPDGEAVELVHQRLHRMTSTRCPKAMTHSETPFAFGDHAACDSLTEAQAIVAEVSSVPVPDPTGARLATVELVHDRIHTLVTTGCPGAYDGCSAWVESERIVRLFDQRPATDDGDESTEGRDDLTRWLNRRDEDDVLTITSSKWPTSTLFVGAGDLAAWLDPSAWQRAEMRYPGCTEAEQVVWKAADEYGVAGVLKVLSEHPDVGPSAQGVIELAKLSFRMVVQRLTEKVTRPTDELIVATGGAAVPTTGLYHWPTAVRDLSEPLDPDCELMDDDLDPVLAGYAMEVRRLRRLIESLRLTVTDREVRLNDRGKPRRSRDHALIADALADILRGDHG